MLSSRILLAYPAVVVLYLAACAALNALGATAAASSLAGYFSIVHMAALVVPLVLLLADALVGTVRDTAAWVQFQLRDSAKKRQ